MNRKVVIIASAVIAFFAGAIWVSEVPTVATFVAFLEVCAGFGCGFFYSQDLIKKDMTKLQEELTTIKEAQKLGEKKIRITTKKSTPKTKPEEGENKEA